jgi:hypothetical protein
MVVAMAAKEEEKDEWMEIDKKIRKEGGRRKGRREGVGLTQFTCSPFQLKVLQFLELSTFIQIILKIFIHI